MKMTAPRLADTKNVDLFGAFFLVITKFLEQFRHLIVCTIIFDGWNTNNPLFYKPQYSQPH